MRMFLFALGVMMVAGLLLGATTYREQSAQQAANMVLYSKGGIPIIRGDISGVSGIQKFGSNEDIDTTTDPEDISGDDSLYVYSSIGVTHYISSTSAADTTAASSIDIEVQGLDSTWATQLDTVSLNGQSKVEIAGTKWVRIFRARNISANAFAGTVYIFENTNVASGVPVATTNVRAVLSATHQQTMMAMYTIPAGKTGYLTSWYVTINKETASAGQANMLIQVRNNGGVFRTQGQTSLATTGTCVASFDLSDMPITLLAKTDVRIRAQAVTQNDTGVSAGFSITMVDN